jgi:hypothetical protein
VALYDLRNISDYIRRLELEMVSIEKKHVRDIFLDPSRRGEWLNRMFGSQTTGCPNFAVNCETGVKTCNPA